MTKDEKCWFCRRTKEEVYEDMPEYLYSHGFEGPHDESLINKHITLYGSNEEEEVGPLVCVVCSLTLTDHVLGPLDTAENIYLYFEKQIRDILKDVVFANVSPLNLDMYRHQKESTITSEKEIETK